MRNLNLVSYPGVVRRSWRRSFRRCLCVPALCVGVALAARSAAADTAPAGRPLTLGEAEAAALRHQPLLAEAEGQVEAAEGRVEQARAGYLPQVSASGTYERTTANFAPRPGFTTQTMVNNSAATPVSWDPRFNFYQYGATASQLFFDFGVTSGRWRSAAAARDAAVSTRRTVELQTLLTVRRAFFLARAQRDLVAVAQETVANQERHAEQTRAFVRTGIQPEINLATVLTALANAKVQLVNARANYELALAQLAQAMGEPPSAPVTPADDEIPAVAGEDGPARSLTEQALRGRPELASLEYQRRSQELLVDALRGGYGPAIGGIANVTETGSSVYQTVPNWYVGFTLSWSIFQGGYTHGQVREAKGTLANVAGQVAAERLQVGIDVEQGRLAVQAAKATIAAADEAVANAKNQLTLAEGRYEHGLGSAVELGDAQVAFTTAEAQVVQARFNLASARAQLLAAMGAR
jgi:outer membrane protein